MASITQSQSARPQFLKRAAGGNGTIPASISILLTAMFFIALAVPMKLFLPALALVATVLATIAGVAGWLRDGPIRSALLTSAGVFAFAAAAAAVLGDPAQVALLSR